MESGNEFIARGAPDGFDVAHATWVAHDLGQVSQTVRVMATQHGDTVGPWRRHLPVLTR